MVQRKGIPPGQKAMVAVESEAFQKAEAEAAERKKAAASKGGKAKAAQQRGECLKASAPEGTSEQARDAVAALFDVSPRSVSDAKALKERAEIGGGNRATSDRESVPAIVPEQKARLVGGNRATYQNCGNVQKTNVGASVPSRSISAKRR